MDRYLETTDGNLVINNSVIVSPKNNFMYLGGEETLTVEAIPLSRQGIVSKLVRNCLDNNTCSFTNQNGNNPIDISFLIELIYL